MGGKVSAMSPQASNSVTNNSRKTRAPRKESKDIDKESSSYKHASVTPNVDKISNDLSAYHTQT